MSDAYKSCLLFAAVLFFVGLGAGLYGGYRLGTARTDHRVRVVEAERDKLIIERDLAVAAAADFREELGRSGELAGQLGDRLSDAVARASRATDYRRGAQIYIDGIRDTLRGLELLASHRAVENTELVPTD